MFREFGRHRCGDVWVHRRRKNISAPLRSKKNRFILRTMTGLKYRGRLVSTEDILYIRALITADPQQSRRTLSKKVCEFWQWRQPNGALRDMICRGLLLMLDRAGQITLPAGSYVRHNPLAARARPAYVLSHSTPLARALPIRQPVELAQERRTSDKRLFNIFMEEHHDLGYELP